MKGIKLKSKYLLGYGLILILVWVGPAWAEWKFEGETNVFYTDDVSIFSASQRLSLKEDPTQPVIEVIDQGADVVFEPAISIGRLFQPSWGDMELTLKAQGFIFGEHTEFNHGTYGISATQMFPAEALLRFRYHFGPDLFLGNNRAKRTEEELIEKEEVTTHFGTIELERDVFENIMVRILGRYGDRSYNKSFKQRDTHFWTLGTHAEWEIHPGIEFIIGYHYERGLADGRSQPQFEEDLSYFSNYLVAELEVNVTPNTSITFGFDFEQNTFTSDISTDEHQNANEKIFQGDIELRHVINDTIDFTMAYQRGQRKFNFESSKAVVNTVWFGGKFHF